MRTTIVSRIYLPEPSAASFWLSSVAEDLLRRGFEVDVITSASPRGVQSPPLQERVRRFPVLRDRHGYVRGYLQYLSFDLPLFFRLMFCRRPDVIIVEPPPTTGAVVRVVGALRRIPIVYDAADIWSDAAAQATSSRIVLTLLRVVERFALRGAAHIVTISAHVAERARALGVDTPVTVTGFGAVTDGFSPSAETDPVLIYAGTASDLHGAEIVIEAFSRIRAKYPRHRLLFVGNLTSADRLREEIRRCGVADIVELRAPVALEELAVLLSRAEVSFATSRPGNGYEYAFASKAYSSWSAGCPVLFAGVGPTADFIDEANRTVRAGAATGWDVDELTAALDTFLAHPISASERAELSAWTQREHSLAAVAHRVGDVVTSVAEGS